MVYRRILTLLSFGVLTATSFASAPIDLGQIKLDSVAYTNNDGTFEWRIDGTNTDIYTYCFSTNNDFSSGENPQYFNVWSIAGTTASDIDASGILSNNNMAGLTATHFLEAAAQAESFGSNYGITSTDDANNALIHNTETNGDPSFDGKDYSNFYYLQQANPSNYSYAGQPQGLVGAPPQNLTPEPTSLAVIGMGALGLLRKRNRASK